MNLSAWLRLRCVEVRIWFLVNWKRRHAIHFTKYIRFSLLLLPHEREPRRIVNYHRRAIVHNLWPPMLKNLLISLNLVLTKNSTAQSCRNGPQVSDPQAWPELLNGRIEVDPLTIPIQKSANTWILGRHCIPIYHTFKTSHNTLHHILLAHRPTFYCYLRPTRSSPYLYHSCLVDADKAGLNVKAAHNSCELLEPVQALVIQM